MSGCSRWNSADGLQETSNCYCHPGIAGGSPAYASNAGAQHDMRTRQLMGGAADVLLGIVQHQVLKMHDEGYARHLGNGRREGAL